MGHRAAQTGSASEIENLSRWCSLFQGCTNIGDVRSRHHATVLGVIQRLRLVPGESMEVVITDGTGRLRATFTGEPIVGLELGSGLRLEGTVCTDSEIAIMRNPSWRIVRDPYGCRDSSEEPRDRVGGARERVEVARERVGSARERVSGRTQPISA